MSDRPAAVIETRGLRRTFKTRTGTVEAVVGVDLRVEAGEVFGFLGPNGAGKTTTLRMLATLLTPSGGDATVAGFDLHKEAQHVREKIGYVGQRGGSDPRRVGARGARLQGRLYGMAKRRRSSGRPDCRVLELDDLRRSGLEDLLRRQGAPPSRSPSGWCTRHSWSSSTSRRPASTRRAAPNSETSPPIARRRATVFLTTHYLEEADALCDRLAIIDHGKIVAEGTPDELKRRISGGPPASRSMWSGHRRRLRS